MPNSRGTALLAALACLIAAAHAFTVGPKPAAPPGIIVRLKDRQVGVAAAAAAAGTGAVRPIAPDLQLYSIAITDGKSAEAKAAEVRKLPGVAYAVPDVWVSIAASRDLQAVQRPPPPSPRRRPPPPPTARTANDAFYKQLWGLPRIKAPQAWTRSRDATKVFTCVVDTGVKYNHPDLIASLVPMPYAWQTKNMDDNGHGTHVAGIIGAVGNNKAGVTGVGWRAQILACKALDAQGWGLISQVVECIDWCRKRKARVINTSFELAQENIPLRDSIGNATAAGVFFAAAAGNAQYSSANNNDVSNIYPGGYKFPGNVAVANMNSNNQLNYNSNYGRTTVQLAAPGTDILSTWYRKEYMGQLYAMRTGTSMAAPYVAGAAALTMSASNGLLTNAQVARLMIATSTPLPALKGKVVANGVINLEQLVLRGLAYARDHPTTKAG